MDSALDQITSKLPSMLQVMSLQLTVRNDSLLLTNAVFNAPLFGPPAWL